MSKQISFLVFLFVQVTFAQPILLTLMSDDVSYEAETLAYQTRVLADGGEITDIDKLNTAILNAKTNDYLDSLDLWVSPSFGVKKDANNKVTTLYDVTTNDNDLVQADTSLCATLLTDSIYFGGANGRYYNFTDINTIRSVFWVVSDVTTGDSRNFLLGDNTEYHFHRGFNRTIWDVGFASANITGGTTRQNGAGVDGTIATVSTIKALITLITSGNVEAGNFSSDRDETGAGGSTWTSYMWELMISSTPFSDTKRDLIETDLNTRYTIY